MKAKQVLTYLLVALAWLWTAYECDTIGVDVFDAILFKEATNGYLVWMLVPILTRLTIMWMPDSLLTRSVMALFMLLPSEVLPLVRPHLPESGFAAIQLVVIFVYILAVIGMYGMFYPWNIEKILKKIGVLKCSRLS